MTKHICIHSSLSFNVWHYIDREHHSRHQLLSGLKASACPGGSPHWAQILWQHFSQRPQASAQSPSPYQSNQGEQTTGALLPGGLAAACASFPAWWFAVLLKHNMDPRRSEGPEPGSRSNVGCHSGGEKSQTSELLCLVVALWCSTCSGHKVTLMSPLTPFDLNIDSWDPVVKERIVFLSCMYREVKPAHHSATYCTWCILPWRNPDCSASRQSKHNPLWAPCRSSPSWWQEHWTSTWGTREKKKVNTSMQKH